MKEPIYSDMQYPHHRDRNGPIPLPAFADQYYDIVSKLKWRLFDFCRIHHIVYSEINSINRKLDEIPKEYMEYDQLESYDDLAKVRLRQAVMDKDIENARISAFTDHIMVVGLWAISEQFMANIYRRHVSKLTQQNEDEVKAPYRWDDFKKSFKEHGIDLESCENYVNADECRALNNAIKHNPKVGSALTKYSFFETLNGQEIERIDLEMQRYLNGVSDFLGSIIDKSQKLIKA